MANASPPQSGSGPDRPDTTTGTIYVADKTTDGKEAYYNFAEGTGNILLKAVPIRVENVRNLSRRPEPGREGYQLVSFHTSVAEACFLDAGLPENKAIIRDVYFDECRRLIQEVSGAAEAYPFVFRVRNQETSIADVDKADFHRDSVPIAHVDRDQDTALQRLRSSLGEDRAEALLRRYKRYGTMNVWRPIRNVVEKWPLVLVDHHAVPGWDYDTHMMRMHSADDAARVSDRGAKDHETLLRYDAGYRYVYAPDMSPDEAWLFYAFHSDPAMAVPPQRLLGRCYRPRRSHEVVHRGASLGVLRVGFLSLWCCSGSYRK